MCVCHKIMFEVIFVCVSQDHVCVCNEVIFVCVLIIVSGVE